MVTGALAGCLDGVRERPKQLPIGYAPDLIPGGPHPYAGEQLTVALDRRTSPEGDVVVALEEALAYWEDNAETYAGFEVSYDISADAGDPDVIVQVVRSIDDCDGGIPNETIGCATYVTSRSITFAPARIRIRADLEGEQLVETLKHELGHTLGLDHDDEPSEIMADDYEDESVLSDRKEGVLGLYGLGVDRHNRAHEAYETGDELYRDGELERAASRFTMAEWEARGGAVHLQNAAEIAREMDVPEAVELCTTASTTVGHLAESAVAMEDAASIAAKGDPGRTEPHVEHAREYYARYEEGDLPTNRELEAVLKRE